MNGKAPSIGIDEIYFAAVKYDDPAARVAYLAEACGADSDLRRQVERLLDARSKRGSFLESPALRPTIEYGPGPIAEGPGTVIGPYKLREQIGEGGMGVVYVAEQSHPVRRKVALKVIKPGMDTKQVVARFEAERQALAMMDHPNIAKVHDGGTTESGRPYFVMELVPGVPITEYCDGERLSVRRAAGAVRARLPRRAARPPEGDHPPRPEALQHPGDASRRRAGPEGHRLRRRQGDGAEPHREDRLHRLVAARRHAAVHEPRAGRDEPARRRYPQRRLFAGRAALRAADRHDPVRQGGPRRAGLEEMRRMIREDEPPTPSTRLSTPGRDAHDNLGEAVLRPEAPQSIGSRRARLDRDEGAGEGPASEVRDGERLRVGCDAIPDRPACGGLPAVGRLSFPEIRPEEQSRPVDGRFGGRGTTHRRP